MPDGDATSLLLAGLLAEPDQDRRWEQLAALVKERTRDARIASLQGLGSGDPRVRVIAADVLGEVANVDSASAAAIAAVLLPLIEREQDEATLQSLIFAVGHTHDARALPAILAQVGHPSEDVRFAVAQVAGASYGIGDNGAVLEALRRLSADPDADVRDWATFGLAHSKATDPATFAALAARSDDPDDDTRAEAIFGLARRHDPRAQALIDRERSMPVYGSLIDWAQEELDG